METGSKRFHRFYSYLFKTSQTLRGILFVEQTTERQTNNTNRLVLIVQVRSNKVCISLTVDANNVTNEIDVTNRRAFGRTMPPIPRRLEIGNSVESSIVVQTPKRNKTKRYKIK